MLAAVPEPINIDDSLRPPTELEGPVIPKHAYAEVFERSSFTGTSAKLPMKEDKQDVVKTVPKKKNAKRLSKAADGKPKRILQLREKGRPNMDHINRYMLDLFSEPLDWFQSFMPLYESDNLKPLEVIDTIGDGQTKFCVANWCRYVHQCQGDDGRRWRERWRVRRQMCSIHLCTVQ